MNAPIYDHLAEHVGHAIAGDWQRALDRLHHHSDTIAPGPPPAPASTGDDMGLADDAASLKSKLQDAVGVLNDALSTDVPNIESLGEVVSTDVLIAAVENASDLPQAERQNLASYITSLNAVFAPPAPAAPAAPAADQSAA